MAFVANRAAWPLPHELEGEREGGYEWGGHWGGRGRSRNAVGSQGLPYHARIGFFPPMATIECKSAQPGIPSVWVEVEGITNDEVAMIHNALNRLLDSEVQVSTAVAKALVVASEISPGANPSDLWQHVIYRHVLNMGWNDNRWKRVSGFALERALVAIYEPRLALYGLRMQDLPARKANRFLATLGADIKATKVDLFLEAATADGWRIFGAAHVKASIAERIQDDVPASQAFMAEGLMSIALTMDAKSYPPPHGDCINYGELGGRSRGVEKDRLKRNYVEVNGQFDGLFSFNLRTPESPAQTPSGKRIHTLSLSDDQPDKLVRFLADGLTAI